MNIETLSTDRVLELYNPFYITRFGLKDIELNSKPAVVHETNNLPHLFDAYFHKQANLTPSHPQAEISLITLQESQNQSVLDNFIQGYPELVVLLQGITERRDLEYQRRMQIRNRKNIFKPIFQNSGAAFPSQAEQWRRDFIYSVTLDHIGDMTYRSGFDLAELCI